MKVRSFPGLTSTALLLLTTTALCAQQNTPTQPTPPPAPPLSQETVNQMISKEKAMLHEWELMETPDHPTTPPAHKSIKVEMNRQVIEKATTQAESTFHQILLDLTLRDALRDVRQGLRARLSTLKLDSPIPPALEIPPLASGDDSKNPPPTWEANDVPLLRERLDRIQSCNDALQTEVNALMSIESHLPPEITHDDISILARIPDPVRKEAKEAETLFQQGHLNQAKDIFATALKKFPTSLYLLSNLAVIHLTQGDIPQAEKLLRQCVAQAPFDAVSYSLLGITVFNAQKDDEALQILARAVALDPDNPKTLNYLALVTSKKGWHSAAETQLRKAIEISPDYAEAHYNLAVLYALSARPAISLAAQHYRRARELGSQKNPELETILKNAGIDTSTFKPQEKPSFTP